MVEEESESTIVAFDYELSSESASTQYMCVCERCLVFGAYEGWAVFSFTSVDKNSPRHFQRVSPSFVLRLGFGYRLYRLN